MLGHLGLTEQLVLPPMLLVSGYGAAGSPGAAGAARRRPAPPLLPCLTHPPTLPLSALFHPVKPVQQFSSETAPLRQPHSVFRDMKGILTPIIKGMCSKPPAPNAGGM